MMQRTLAMVVAGLTVATVVGGAIAMVLALYGAVIYFIVRVAKFAWSGI